MSVLSAIKQHILLLIDPPVTRKQFPRPLFGEWEFITRKDGSVIARIYTVPPTEEIFRGKHAARLARSWVRQRMHLVEKGV